VTALVGHVEAALEDTGDAALVRTLLKGLLAGGTGAERQRSAAVRGRAAVVDLVAEHTAPNA
jgi:carboxylate-amine ligase